VLKNGERVATIAFKHPKDGAGRLAAYVHWIGIPMVRGTCTGYGYDKKSAACESAAMHMAWKTEETSEDLVAFFKAIKDIGGSTFDSRLRDAGFTVCQAV
jgi:hypothetical protein